MDIPAAYTVDTHGALVLEEAKIDVYKPCLESVVNSPRELSITYNNIDFKAIPGLNPARVTYRFTLSYNGTMGRDNSLYSQVVMDEVGILNIADLPVFTYKSDELAYDIDILPSDVILNLNFLTAEANILQFKGVPIGGNNGPFTISSVNKYTFPFTIDKMVTGSGTTTYFDGWYTATFVIFKDMEEGVETPTSAGIYAYKGVLYEVTSGSTLHLSEDGVIISGGNTLKSSYEDYILKIGAYEKLDPLAGLYLANSQIMVTQELNDAIIKEVKDSAEDPACDDTCTIADWQKLQQKKLGSYIYFTEHNFRHSQVILESARKACNRNYKNC